MSNTAKINLCTDAITTNEILLVVRRPVRHGYMGAQNRPNTILRAKSIVKILVLTPPTVPAGTFDINDNDPVRRAAHTVATNRMKTSDTF